jgi:NADH-quinone oxidoreductase subunit N
MVLMLLVRIFRGGEKIPPFLLALLGSVVALGSALPSNGMNSWAELEPCQLFTGMLVYDTLSVYIRIFLLAFLVLFVILSRLTGIADCSNGQDYYTLVFGATLGMCIMASANHLIVVFLGIEMASVPSYVLAGIVQGRRRSSEAALKYAIYGAGTAGVMLYGISLLAGLLGTAYLPTMAQRLAALDISAMMEGPETTEGEQTEGAEGKPTDPDHANSGNPVSSNPEVHDQGAQTANTPQVHSPMVLMVLALGGLMLGVGLAFKLSAVPFHFWCPDVFEGASAEVDAFLSVASKAAAMVLLLRIGLGLGSLPETVSSHAGQVASQEVSAAAMTMGSRQDTAGPQARLISTSTVSTGLISTHSIATDQSQALGQADDALAPVRHFMVLLVGLISVVTCTFGNLAAYGQQNIKRMLAYSTIAHAGYMMMAVAAAIALVGQDPLQMRVAVQSLLLYASIYFFMNLGAFSFVAFLRNAMGSEEIKDYAGLIRCCPWMTVSMVAILFSLVGLPPLAGFIGKFRIFQALFEAGGPWMMFLLVVAGLNTAISLVYYLRVAKTMCMDPEPDTRGPVSLGFLPVAYTLLVSFPVLLFGILPGWLADWAYQATAHLFT